MPQSDPFRRLETFGAALKNSQKEPAMGVTQGGSSAKFPGARVAAKDADTQNRKENAE